MVCPPHSCRRRSASTAVALLAVLAGGCAVARAQNQVMSSNVISAVCATPDTKIFCQVLKQGAKADPVVALLGSPFSVLTLFVSQDRGFTLTRKLLQTSLGVPDVATLLANPVACARLVRANLALGLTLPVSKWRSGVTFADSYVPGNTFTTIIGKRTAAYVRYLRNTAKVVRHDWRIANCRMQVMEVPLYPF